MAGDLKSILDQLVEVRTKLEDAPEDDFEARVQLRERLVELRAAASAAAETATARPSLERYLRQLERRREDIMALRLDDSWEDGGLGGIGMLPEQTKGLNRLVEEAGGLPALEDEISRVRSKLAAAS